jgi:AcrR family transcriptional regulator
MATSALRPSGGRAEKQALTRVRIVRCAQRLCLEAGFDGFTMDELAEAAAVSRRTLFNYFPSKVDAVLGGAEAPDLASQDLAEVAETFRAGGPHGRLGDDLAELARHLLATQVIDRESARLRRTVLTSSPRLLSVIHERFESLAEQIVGLVLEREGPDFGPVRARLAVGVLVAVFDTAMETFSHGDADDPELADLVAEHLGLVTDLFA